MRQWVTRAFIDAARLLSNARLPGLLRPAATRGRFAVFSSTILPHSTASEREIRMKRILLTGAGGGIGTYLRRELRGVYALRLSDREPVANLPNDDFMTAELTDFDAVAALMDGMDGIIHMGGYSVEGA